MNTKIFEIQEMRNRRQVFTDRFEAGKTLASMLQTKYDHIEGGMILAIPSGGVPIGIKARETLGLPFDLMVVRKLQIPGNPEAGFGAMTLDGTTFFNDGLLSKLRLNASHVEAEKRRVAIELDRRNRLFRQARPFPEIEGRRVILMDDGLASGFTMLASIDMVRKAGARETVVAVPTAPKSSIDRLSGTVNEIYCANIRTTPFFAVAEAYRYWYDLSEKEVMELLEY